MPKSRDGICRERCGTYLASVTSSNGVKWPNSRVGWSSSKRSVISRSALIRFCLKRFVISQVIPESSQILLEKLHLIGKPEFVLYNLDISQSPGTDGISACLDYLDAKARGSVTCGQPNSSAFRKIPSTLLLLVV